MVTSMSLASGLRWSSESALAWSCRGSIALKQAGRGITERAGSGSLELIVQRGEALFICLNHRSRNRSPQTVQTSSRSFRPAWALETSSAELQVARRWSRNLQATQKGGLQAMQQPASRVGCMYRGEKQMQKGGLTWLSRDRSAAAERRSSGTSLNSSRSGTANPALLHPPPPSHVALTLRALPPQRGRAGASAERRRRAGFGLQEQHQGKAENSLFQLTRTTGEHINP